MIKPNEKVTDRKETELIQLRGDYEAAREMMTLKDHPGWVRIREILDTQLAEIDIRLDDFIQLQADGRDYILKERIDLRRFRNLVDNAENTLGALSAKISALEAVVNERKRIDRSNPVV